MLQNHPSYVHAYVSLLTLDPIYRLLLSHNANPNLKDALGNNPLHLAACTHHMEVVTLLLKGGKQIYLKKKKS